MDNVLLFFALKYKGNWEKIYTALEEKEKISHQDLISVQSKIDCNFLSIINPVYPNSLKNFTQPSFVLFGDGNFNLLGRYHQIIAVTGGEEFNKYGQEKIDSLVKELIQERQIILTGGAPGIEQVVIQAVIREKGRLIIVPKIGFQNFVSQNKELVSQLKQDKIDYLIVGESYNSQDITVDINKFHSRLKVGLASNILFGQIKSTDSNYQMSKIIANTEKKVCAIPEQSGSPYNGNNILIQQGAKLVEAISDILSESEIQENKLEEIENTKMEIS